MATPAPQPHTPQTAPTTVPAGARVWMDVTGTILGHGTRLSPLGADVLERALHQFNRVALRVERPVGDPRNVVGVYDGRAWLNLSGLRGYLSASALGRWVAEVDPGMAGRLDAESLGPTDDLRAPHLLPGLVMQGARAMASAVAGQLQPARAAVQAQQAWTMWHQTVVRRAGHGVDSRGLRGWIDHLLAPTAALVVHELMPLIALATTAARTVREPFAHRADCQPLLHALCGGLSGHRTTTFLLDAASVRDTASLLHDYGHLGLEALDVARPRFADQPTLLDGFREALPSADRLEADQARAAQARKLAVATLASELTGPLERARFLAAADVVQELGGLSDWPLEALLMCLAPIRQKLLERHGRDDAAFGLRSLDHLDPGVDSAEPPEPVRRGLPGIPLQTAIDEGVCAVVGGRATGTLARPGHGRAPARPIWVLESLDLRHTPHVASGVGCVVVDAVPRGPGAQLAATLGRPCVWVRSHLLPPLGTPVTLDGTRSTIECST